MLPALGIAHGACGVVPGMTKLFDPVSLGALTLRNRLILPPMCQYTVAAKDGVPVPWHLAHLGARAAGGFGMVVAEATSVSPEGRISDQDTGLWNDAQRDAWKPVTEFIRSQGAVAAVQIAHAGAKASTPADHPGNSRQPLPVGEGGWETVSPSGIHPVSGLGPTRALTDEGVEELIRAWGEAARRAAEAGFQVVQIHAAHGYLIHQFLSPVTNQRTDRWGGSWENRTRFLRRIVDAVVAAVPDEVAVGIRFSGSDWLQDSWGIEDTVALVRELVPAGVQWVDLSSGGIGDTYQGPKGPGYQVPLAEQVKRGTADLRTVAGQPLLVSAVGSITDPQMAADVVEEGRADAVGIGRAALVRPNWPVEAAQALEDERYREQMAPEYHRGVWGRLDRPAEALASR